MASQTATPALELNALAKSYRWGWNWRSRPVLRDIHLQLERGQRLALIGPNGSGKSTLLRLLAGVEAKSAGSLRVLGGDPRERSTRRRLAYLPEDSPYPAELSARAVLDLCGSIAGLGRRTCRARAESLLERVGLAQAARVPLRRYSRGMLRRFGLAQVFLCEPELLLLDEPTAGLDARGFEVVDDLLAEASQRGATLVLASHVLSDLAERCDQVAVLIEGELLARGSALTLLPPDAAQRYEVAAVPRERQSALAATVVELGGSLRPLLTQSDLVALYRRHGQRKSVP